MIGEELAAIITRLTTNSLFKDGDRLPLSSRDIYVAGGYTQAQLINDLERVLEDFAAIQMAFAVAERWLGNSRQTPK